MKTRQYIVRTCMLLLLTLMTAHLNAANLTHELGINVETVAWYNDQAKTQPITSVTLDATTHTIYVDIQPVEGYWTDISLLKGVEKIGSPGAAGARMKRSPSYSGLGAIAQIEGENYARNGAGLYQVTVPALAAGQTAEQIAEICLIGTINECTDLSDADVTITASSAVYSGVAQTASTTSVTLGTTDLTEGTDYTVTLNDGGTNVGKYAVEITGMGRYKGTATNSTAFEITKAELTITAKPKTITYGDAPANDGVTYSGFVNGETSSVLGGSLAYAYTYTQYGDVGSSYIITPSGLTSGNYELTFATGTLTVEQKEVGLTWSDISLTYTGSAQAPTATATGLVNNDVIGVTVTGGQTDAGTGYTATASALTGAKSGNYKLPEANTTTFSISSAAIAGVTVGGYNSVYDGAAHGITVSVPEGTTIKYGTTEGNYNLDDNPTYTAVGNYPVYYQITKDNYTTVTGSQTVIITKAALTVTAKPKTITYGDAPANDGVTYSGFVNGETSSVLGGALAYAYTYTQYGDVGSSYTITPSGLTSGNYELTFATGTLTVEQKEVGLTWSDISLTYTGSAQAPTATATGLVNNDVIGVTVIGGQTDAGTGYTATASALTGAKSANYKLPAANTTSFSISSAAITGVTVSGYNSVYDGIAHGITISAPEGTTIKYGTTEGNYNLDDNPTYTAVGNYPVYYQITKDNYTTVTGSQTVIITKAELTITAKPKTISFGDAPANDGVTYSRFVNGESEAVLGGTLDYDYNYSPNDNVGTYNITPKGLTSNNYNISFVAGTLTVNPKVIEEETDGTGVTQDEDGYTVTVTETTENTSAEIINLTDNETVFSLTYSRTLSYPTGNGDIKINNEATNLYTICLPYAPTPTEHLKFYKLTSGCSYSLVFEEVSTPAANTPYLVAVSGDENITIAPEAISNLALQKVISESTVNGGYTMMGTHTGLSNSEVLSLVGEGNYSYILQSNSTWDKVVDGDIYIPPFRAFIKGPSIPNDARLTGRFEGEATGINTLRLVDHDGSEQWYDLNGRRIDRPSKKGLYIHKGKKVTIK